MLFVVKKHNIKIPIDIGGDVRRDSSIIGPFDDIEVAKRLAKGYSLPDRDAEVETVYYLTSALREEGVRFPSYPYIERIPKAHPLEMALKQIQAKPGELDILLRALAPR